MKRGRLDIAELMADVRLASPRAGSVRERLPPRPGAFGGRAFETLPHPVGLAVSEDEGMSEGGGDKDNSSFKSCKSDDSDTGRGNPGAHGSAGSHGASILLAAGALGIGHEQGPSARGTPMSDATTAMGEGSTPRMTPFFENRTLPGREARMNQISAQIIDEKPRFAAASSRQRASCLSALGALSGPSRRH